MEKMEKSPRTKAEIEAELRSTEKDLFDLEQSVNTQHEEYGGTSSDDNSQEAAADDTKLALLRMSIEGKRRRIEALNQELQGFELEKAA